MTPKGCYQPICQLCFVSPSEGQMSEAILFGCEFLILTVSGQHAGRVQGGNYVSLELLLFSLAMVSRVQLDAPLVNAPHPSCFLHW